MHFTTIAQKRGKLIFNTVLPSYKVFKGNKICRFYVATCPVQLWQAVHGTYLLARFLVDSQLDFPVGSLSQFLAYFESETVKPSDSARFYKTEPRLSLGVCRCQNSKACWAAKFLNQLPLWLRCSPVLQFTFVVVELDSAGVFHPPHDVDHVLLVDPHLAGLLGRPELFTPAVRAGYSCGPV